MSEINKSIRDLGTVSYDGRKAKILDSGTHIRDEKSGVIYNSVLLWVSDIDIAKGRNPPPLSPQPLIPKRKVKKPQLATVHAPFARRNHVWNLESLMEDLEELEEDFPDDGIFQFDPDRAGMDTRQEEPNYAGLTGLFD